MPLCLHEPTTSACKTLRFSFGRIVWWAAFVEIRSGIARGARHGNLSAMQSVEALDRLSELRSGWNEILPCDDLRELAAGLLDQYDLRAADSMQLAAALLWCSRKPAGRTFICSDQRLCNAAEAAGFTVIRPGVTTP
jgi:predicted nucleic acid-binding protein